MNTGTRDVRIAAIYDVGVKLDDALEAARLETARREGAKLAYLNAAKNILSFVNQIKDPAAQEILNKSVEICKNLADQATALVHAGRGSEHQARNSVSLIKQLHDAEVQSKRKDLEAVAAVLSKPSVSVPVLAPAAAEVTPEPAEVVVKPLRTAPKSLKQRRQNVPQPVESPVSKKGRPKKIKS